MNKPTAIYTRVSSDRQEENHTIASQTAALLEYAKTNGYVVPPEWIFQDEGYSGASLLRPGLEALRDLAAQGQIATVLIYSPDRLPRKYAYQVLLAEEFSRCGVEIVFLKSPSSGSPEDQLVVQFQGMILNSLVIFCVRGVNSPIVAKRFRHLIQTKRQEENHEQESDAEHAIPVAISAKEKTQQEAHRSYLPRIRPSGPDGVTVEHVYDY